MTQYNIFDILLQALNERLTKLSIRAPICVKERLTLTIRYLTAGESYRSLSFQFRMGITSVSQIVSDTCAALYEVLHQEYVAIPNTADECHEVTSRFWEKCNIPNTSGAIDVKHILILKPPRSGTTYFNYKRQLSENFNTLLFVAFCQFMGNSATQFPYLPKLMYSVIYVLIFIVGLIGNGLLIGTIRKRMTVANVFLVNLATSDLLLCITALPITPVLAFVKRWIFGNVMCKLVPLCQGISVLISSYCLCLIAVDRYRSIVTPLKVPWSVGQAQTFMVFCWMGSAQAMLLSVTISSPLFLTQRLQQIVLGNTTLCGQFCGEYDWPQDTRVKLAYGSALLIVQYLIPVSIMTFCYWKILQKVRQDWIVSSGSMLTEAQQAQTSIRKRRVMYVLILMVAVFMGSWMPLTVVNILRDIGVGFLDIQMYFKLLNVHAIAMTSIVSNPLLYFWMSKRHRRALKDDMFWFTNVRRQQQMGLLEKFAPSPSLGILYRKSLERHLLSSKYNPYRRGTLADPTCMSREKALQEMHANCFLLVPLMPLCVPATRSSSNAGFKDPSLLHVLRQKM